MRLRILFLLFSLIFVSQIHANPYWDQNKVPKDSQYPHLKLKQINPNHLKSVHPDTMDVVRIQADWLEESETYTLSRLVIEPSGTPALFARSTHKPKWGSYLGVLKDNASGKVYYDSIGTGKQYRRLTRAINLRFPVPSSDMTFELFAENPQTGVMEKVLEKIITPGELVKEDRVFVGREIKELALAKKSPSLTVAIYAEGYSVSQKNKFWQRAMKVVQALKTQQFPGVDYMSFYAVFNPSDVTLGEAEKLGKPIPEYPSFLGLYYPYWDDVERWYNIVYPTRENKLRQGLASAAYDYPIILINNDEYWGVGNYMSFTAIPADSTPFTYLLLHEFGHFFGLNEEYEGGGRTELEFAADMDEPWSQNITFLTDPSYLGLKWHEVVMPQTKIPTPFTAWESHPPVYGAYRGGYGSSTSSKGLSHIPGLNCVMEAKRSFCAVCTKGILDVIHFSLGLEN